jgi:hypothetical protein
MDPQLVLFVFDEWEVVEHHRGVRHRPTMTRSRSVRKMAERGISEAPGEHGTCTRLIYPRALRTTMRIPHSHAAHNGPAWTRTRDQPIMSRLL